MESILTSIKKLLGIPEEEKHFDPDIIMHINSVFTILTQLGVGPSDGFIIEDDLTTWNDFLGEGSKELNSVKSYMFMKVKLLFDTSTTSSAALDSMNRLINEFEWRLNVTAENKQTE